MRKIFTIILLSLIIQSYSYAQMGVPVNLQTGAPSIGVPIYVIGNGDVSVPISLYYAPGVKISQPAGNDDYKIGAGWGLSAGGSISRTVKGLPDDYKGVAPDTRMGWLYGTGAAAVAGFTPQNHTNPTPDCTNDVANYSTLNSFVNQLTDTEPDVFNFNFGGYSGQFMFGNNKIIQTLPYQDLKIVPTYSAYDGSIASFTITTNSGVQYTFAPTTTVTMSVTPVAANATIYLKNKLNLYGKQATYTTVWRSTQIKSPSGGSVSLTYGNQMPVGILITPSATKATNPYPGHYQLPPTPAGYTVVVSGIDPSQIINGALPRSTDGTLPFCYFVNNSTGISTTVVPTFVPDPVDPLPPTTDIYLGTNGSSGTILPNGSLYKNSLYYTQAIVNTRTLSSISEKLGNPYGPLETDPGNETINFIYQGSSLSSFQVVAPSTGNVPIKTISLNAVQVNGYRFLQSVQTSAASCLTTPPYQFQYVGTNIDTSPNSTSLPYAQGYVPGGLNYCQQDYWGYYNANNATTLVPNLFLYPNEPLAERYRLQPIPNYNGTYFPVVSGADRTVNPNAITMGTLYRIIYPTGGNVKIDYEPNQYLDARTNQTFFGGGIRVKTVTLHDGVNAANDIVKNYTYSGGALINRPQFAFPIPVYSGNSSNGYIPPPCTNCSDPTSQRFFTAISEYDLNAYDFDFPGVMYQLGTESMTGKGKTVCQYIVPATYGQTSVTGNSTTTPWQATFSRYATTTDASAACLPISTMADGNYGFPYPTNPNYSFERGLLQSVKTYNETSQLLKETVYTYTPIYQQNASPGYIYGLAFDYFDNSTANAANAKAFAYGKYSLFAGVDKYQTSTIETTYDPTNLTKSATVQTDNAYGSLNPSLLSITKTSVSNDGVNFTTYKTKYKYIQDYTATGTDAATVAILALQNSFRNSTLIEKINTITKPGLSEQVTGAQLIKYNTFSIVNQPQPNVVSVLPAQTFTLKTNQPLGDFQASTISGNLFQSDPRYQVTGNISEYSVLGLPVSVDDGHQQAAATLYDNSGLKPIASIKNALASQVLYSNFDDDYPLFSQAHNFEAAAGSSIVRVAGRMGMGLSIPPGFVFTKSAVNKGLGSSYVFSCWTQSPANAAGTITVTLSDGTHSSSKVLNYPAGTAGGWSYSRVMIPVSTLNPTFSVSVQNGSQQVIVDDMLLYPGMAQVALAGYQNKFKISGTDPHGNTTFYTYDPLGRPTIVTDQTGSILKRSTYSYGYTGSYQLNAGFTYDVAGGGTEFTAPNPPSPVIVNSRVDFLNYGVAACEQGGITRAWVFGDGATYVGANPSHTYTNPGIYQVQLTVSSPIYGSVTSTQYIRVATQLSFTLHAKGSVVYDMCNQQTIVTGEDGIGGLPPGTITFTATPSAGATNYFMWQMAYSNAPNNWISIPGSSNTVTVNVANTTPGPGYNGPLTTAKSFMLQCIMNPQSATENVAIKTYSIQYIAPGCTP